MQGYAKHTASIGNRHCQVKKPVSAAFNPLQMPRHMVAWCSVVTGFSVKMSTALSQAVIAGGAVGSTAYALSRRHPLDRKRPLVDFELTLMLTPMLLLGVSGGGS